MELTRRSLIKGGIGVLATALLGSGCDNHLDSNLDQPILEIPPTTIYPIKIKDKLEFEREHQKDFSMAFVIVSPNLNNVSEEEREYVDAIRRNFEWGFNEATSNLAIMDTSYAPVLLEHTEVVSPEGDLLIGEVIPKFFDSNLDSFDFISFYPAISRSDLHPYHHPIQNKLSGIGSAIFDWTERYGSSGRLLGVNIISTLAEYLSSGNKQLLDPQKMGAELHELGHTWGVKVGHNFTGKNDGTKLELRQDNIHFYRGLQSPFNSTTPMNSDHWVPNGDGTYHRLTEKFPVEPYHPIQLYFMGLFPEEGIEIDGIKYTYDTSFQIYDCGGADTGRPFNPEHAVPHSQVSINDIIQVEGSRQWMEAP